MCKYFTFHSEACTFRRMVWVFPQYFPDACSPLVEYKTRCAGIRAQANRFSPRIIQMIMSGILFCGWSRGWGGKGSKAIISLDAEGLQVLKLDFRGAVPKSPIHICQAHSVSTRGEAAGCGWSRRLEGSRGGALPEKLCSKRYFGKYSFLSRALFEESHQQQEVAYFIGHRVPLTVQQLPNMKYLVFKNYFSV